MEETLTGFCKEVFNKWYPNYISEQREDYGMYEYEELLRMFEYECFAAKWGIYQDFFEDMGLIIGKDDIYSWFVYQIGTDENYICDSRLESIQQANEIINSN